MGNVGVVSGWWGRREGGVWVESEWMMALWNGCLFGNLAMLRFLARLRLIEIVNGSLDSN